LVNEHAFNYEEDWLDLDEDLYDYYVTYWTDMHPNAAAQGWGWKKVECPVYGFRWFLTNQNFDDDDTMPGWLRERGFGSYTGQTNEDGRAHGQGFYTWADGRKYEGEWKDGKQHGKGIYTWPDERGYSRRKYEGEWKDGKWHGKGMMEWWSGDKYEGEWKDGNCLW
jgi:hypothetical protein